MFSLVLIIHNKNVEFQLVKFYKLIKKYYLDLIMLFEWLLPMLQLLPMKTGHVNSRIEA